MQELYKKHNFNPLAGCLPVFLQLPIFMGLYRSLAVDVELRGAPLIERIVPLVLEPRRSRHALALENSMPAFYRRAERVPGTLLHLLPCITAGFVHLAATDVYAPAG